ncbi:MAG: efflux RND transporter periplasmic adaptor subunit [Deltaproteobacteria bacterium]|nr:efflux RND transporter periplasmic adaptor subunit [Deltaproteobacteria bacterium]
MTPSNLLRRLLDLLRRARWLLLLGAAAFALLWFRVLAPVPVERARLERGLVVKEAFGRGLVESQREAAVGFDLVGRLSQVLVEEGTRVSLGQELARLETSQALADLRSAQTGISAARSSLERLAAEEERARAVLAAAEREAARTQALFASGAIGGQARDDTKDRLRLARADLDRVLAQRSEATRGIDVARGGAEQRRVAMVRATLLAPFEGLVTRRLREPGDTVTIGSTVLRLVDTNRVHVSAAVDETVLSELAVDQPATIHFPGRSDAISGKVTRISWEADRQTHEIEVEVTPDRLAQRVAIGQRADVRIELARKARVLRLPLRMLQRDAEGTFVYVDRGGRIATLRPKLGVTGKDHVEVLAGLAEGEIVLAAASPAGRLPLGRRWRTP